ncbi:acyltransferase [Priestia megaterium]|uniref:acyltransferase n=1 Tax=Priestia megaterium TaxID=1404 RepID=UPI0003A428FF|nr:acyltransferase [Priestia megaterium]QFY72015.1 acetyltransferase [Priestia megaterium]
MTVVDKAFAVTKGSLLKFKLSKSGKLPRLRGGCSVKSQGQIVAGDNLSITGRPIKVSLNTENKESKIVFGNNVFINYGVDIGCARSVRIGDNVKIGPLTNIIDSNYHLVDSNDSLKSEQVVIENNVWIGRGCSILSGVTIGENSVVAAGSVVNKDVPPNVLVAGSPAKIVKNLEIKDGWIRD